MLLRALKPLTWGARVLSRTVRPPSSATERICLAVLAMATLWFGGAAIWEIAGPFGAGHVAASASIGVAGENMFRWGIWAPVLDYTLEPPSPRDYYCHHPWGIFWTTAALVKLFGHHDWVCRLPPVLFSIATPPLLYAIARALWSPVAGAVAAAGFVVVPIALAFANFNALEVPVIFGCLVAMWGTVRLHQTWQRRWLVVSLLGLFQAVNSDWAGFIFAGCLLGFFLPRALLLNGRWFGPVDVKRSFAWWALASSMCVLVFVFYVHQFQEAGQLAQFLAQGELRSRGSSLPLADVLKARSYWIDLSFTPLAVFLGKVAAVLLVLRVIVLKRDLEVLPLALLVMATVQYVAFKQGADVHVFWPHYFAPYFALGLAAMAASAEGLLAWGGRRRGKPRLSRAAPFVALGLGLSTALAILPDGVRALRYARNSGGRFDEKGLIIHQDVDKAVLMKWLSPKLESGTSVEFHPSMKYSWSLGWSLGRPVHLGGRIPTKEASGPRQYFIADARFSEAEELRALASRFAVRVFGPYWFVDRSSPPAPIQAHRFTTREPTALEWLFVQAHDPIYSIEHDPHATWELREHFLQTPNPLPQKPPRGFDELRIAHNAALARGDGAAAARHRGELLRTLDRGVAREYPSIARLLGVAYRAGVTPRLDVVFEALGDLDRDLHFAIHSQVEEAPSFSLVPADEKVRVVGMPFALPTDLWKAGFIYGSTTEIRKRPGTERFYGFWEGAAELDAHRAVDLLTVR